MGISIDLIDDPESSGQDIVMVYTGSDGKLDDIEIVEVDLDE